MSTSFITHRREGTVKMLKPQPQRKEARSALDEYATGAETATGPKNVQLMGKNANTVES